MRVGKSLPETKTKKTKQMDKLSFKGERKWRKMFVVIPYFTKLLQN